MTAPEGRVRISLAAGELEIEGSSEFVMSYNDEIKDMLKRLSDAPRGGVAGDGAASENGSGAETDEPAAAPDGSAPSSGEKREFGEVLNELPNSATGTDQILLAGWFASNRGGREEPFSTGDAHKLLIEQGIRLSNAAQCMKNNSTAKRVFKAGKGWRISRSGVDHLRSMHVL